MTRRAFLSHGPLPLAVSALVLFTLAWSAGAGEEASGTPLVTGTVYAEGLGTLADIEVFRLGDVDPLIGVGLQIRRDPPTVANSFAIQWGAVAQGPVRSLRTDAEGRFSLAALEPGGYVAWAADAEGHGGGRSFRVHPAGAREVVQIPLSTGDVTLRVRIERRPGEPFRGPVVVVSCDEHGDKYEVGRWTTDATGLLVAPGLWGGDVQLVAVAKDGAAAISRKYGLPAPSEVTWVMESGQGQDLRGRVLAGDDDAPIAGALVEAVSRGEGGSAFALTARTGPQGEFLIPMRRRAVAVVAFAAGFDSREAHLAAGDPETVLRLERQHALRGRLVKKGTDEGVDGVTVHAYDLGRLRSRRHATQTDAGGRFEFQGLSTSEWMVFAMGNGWVSEGLWNVAWQTFNPFVVEVSGSPVPEHRLEVVEAGSLRGVVLDDAGRPVAGAKIDAVLESTPVSDQAPLWSFGTAVSVVSGSDGTFEHRGLLPGGMYRFRTTIHGFPPPVSAPVLMKPGEGNEPVELRLSAQRWLRVHVVDRHTGGPVVGAAVYPAILNRWGASRVGGASSTGADGVAKVGPLPEGSIGVFVDAEAYVHPGRDPVPVPAEQVGSENGVFQIPLEEGVVVAGRVLVPAGAPSDGITVRAFISPARRHHDDPVRTAEVARDGSFRLVGLRRASRYVLAVARTVEGGTWVGDRKCHAPAADAEIPLRFHPDEVPSESELRRETPDLYRGQHRIRVRVTTPGGKPLGSAHIRVHPKQLNPHFPVRDGSALIAVPPRAERICIEFGGGEDWDPTHGGGMYGPFDATLDTLSVQLDAGKAATGRVLDPLGSGVGGVRVSVLPVDPLRSESPHRYEFWYSAFEARTDATGRFAIRGLRPGDYTLALAAPPQFILEDLRRFTLSESEVAIRLRRGVEVDVRVLDDQGRPFAGAQVQARRLEGDPAHERWELVSQAYSGRDGVARLQGLDAEQLYRLGVDPDSDVRLDLEDRKVHDWKPADTTVELERK